MHITKKNIFFIKKLYSLIKKNHKKEIPIASLIIENNNIISIKKNSNNKNKPLHHAENLAIKEALKIKENLNNCILFTTLEPCLMCVGSAIHVNIKIIYYLCKSPVSGIQTKYKINCLPNISIIPILLYEKKINFLIKIYFENKR